MIEATTTVVPAPQEIKLTPAQEARFWAKVNKAGPTMPGMASPCWVWTAGKDSSGYGLFWANKHFKAHRVAWMIANGPIPHDGSAHGICVCHRCDNPACCRVDHFFLGTNADNIADRDAKGRNVAPTGERHGSYLHPEKWTRGERCALSKLKASDVSVILNSYHTGMASLQELAVRFNVYKSTIHRIVIRKTWKHIPILTTGPQCDTKAIGCE